MAGHVRKAFRSCVLSRAAIGSLTGDYLDIAIRSASNLQVSIGNIGDATIAQGIRKTTWSSYTQAPVFTSIGEMVGATVGGFPSAGDSVAQSLQQGKGK